MRTSRALAKQIIDTYATVLLEAAIADSTVDVVGTQLDEAAAIVRGHADLRDALLDDNIDAEHRGAITREVFGSFDPALVATLGLMAERGNIDLLSSVVEAYARVTEERLDTVAVDVTTVVELNDALREAISTKLAADFGKKVVLREKVDPSIIGGIIFSTHGQRLDASIAHQLEAARSTLSTAHTGGDA